MGGRLRVDVTNHHALVVLVEKFSGYFTPGDLAEDGVFHSVVLSPASRRRSGRGLLPLASQGYRPEPDRLGH